MFHQNVARLAPGHASTCELRIRHKDGGIRWLACSAERDERSPQNPEPHLFGGLVDITERKAAELRYKAVWESSIDPMRLTDKDGVIVQVNDAFVRWVGIPKQELEGSLFTCIYAEGPPAIRAGVLSRPHGQQPDSVPHGPEDDALGRA